MTYRLTPVAASDLDSIATYVGERDCGAALRLLQSFTRRWQSLAAQPDSGRLRDDIGADLRSVDMGNYLAFYRVEREAVVIVRVLHGSRKLEVEKRGP